MPLNQNKASIRMDPRLNQMVSWLETNLKVLACWRDEIAGIDPAQIDLVACLDTHHNWLSGELVRLTDQKVERHNETKAALGRTYPSSASAAYI